MAAAAIAELLPEAARTRRKTGAMADVKEIRVFIASPADVQEERDAVERVIEKVNLSVAGLDPRVMLRAIRWETAVQPAIGGDSQAIINSQLAGEYEVFIGILWMHFGTPTPRSDSGTLEEFEAAVARHKEDSSSVSVMFYFKDTPRAPMDIDTEQLQKVQEFRKKYKEDGIYGTFTDTGNFKETLQMNLTRLAIECWRKGERQIDATHLWKWNPVVTANEAEDDSGESHIDPLPPQGSDDDPGFLDLLEEGEQGFVEGTVVLKRLEKHILELGKKTARGTEDLNATNDGFGNINLSKSKKIINFLADDVERIATGIQAEIVPFKNTYGKGIRAYGQAANLLSDFGGSTAEEQLEGAISITSTLERGISKAQAALLGLKNGLVATPRVTSKYNKAKKKILEVLAELDREMSAARTSTKQTRQFLEELHREVA